MLHYRKLKFYILKGMKIKKIHTIYTFKQRKWLGEYTDHNTQMRTKAKSDFEKDFFKLMDNAFHGKTMENVRGRVNIDFILHNIEWELSQEKTTWRRPWDINLC